MAPRDISKNVVAQDEEGVAATDWTFNGTWPYQPKWFDSPDGRMHYVDEGPSDGKPVILAHGNPTWGYLYRNFIGQLADPDAEVERIEDAGHYVQEDAYERIVPVLIDFLQR